MSFEARTGQTSRRVSRFRRGQAPRDSREPKGSLGPHVTTSYRHSRVDAGPAAYPRLRIPESTCRPTPRPLLRVTGRAGHRALDGVGRYSGGMCVQQLGRRGSPKGGHHDVTERQAHGSQPVQVRSGETPGSPVARPPASGEIPASRRGAAQLTSPQHQAKPAAS